MLSCHKLRQLCHFQTRGIASLAERFEQDGYISKHKIMTESEMDKFKADFQTLESTKEGKKFVPQEINLHFKHQFIFDLCIHPQVIEAVKSLLGPNIVLLSSTVFTKYPAENSKPAEFVGWHQDLKYWGLVSATSSRIKLASMWLAIDKADADNGAMKFIKSSHTQGFFDHVDTPEEGNVLNENQDMVLRPEWMENVVQTELLPGECTFHDGMLVHGSSPTLSRRRMGLTAQFCQPQVIMEPMKYTKTQAFADDFRKPILICGEDTFGKLEYFKL